MTIRPATVADLDDVVAMGETFYHQSSWAARATFCRTSARATAEQVIANGVVLLAEIEGKPVGLIGFYFSPFAMNFGVKTATEVMFWVGEDHRSSGLGLQLLNEAKDAAMRAGCAWFVMGVLDESPPQAVAMYERAGFVKTESSYLLEL